MPKASAHVYCVFMCTGLLFCLLLAGCSPAAEDLSGLLDSQAQLAADAAASQAGRQITPPAWMQEESDTPETPLSATLPEPQTAQDANTPLWTMHQGNASHNGYVPVSLDPQKFTVRWRKKTPAGGSAETGVMAQSPVVGSGKVFRVSPSLLAHDEATGAIIWSQRYDGATTVSPVSYANGLAYVQLCNPDQSAYLAKYYANTGGSAGSLPYESQWSTYDSPTIFGTSVYYGGGRYGGMICHTPEGSPNWSVSLPDEDYWTPAVDPNYAYAFLGGKLWALNRMTGAQVFTISDPNWNYDYAKYTPVLGSMNDAFSVYADKVICYDLINRRIAWEVKAAEPYGFGNSPNWPAVANGVFYIVQDGKLTARDEATGTLLWDCTGPNGTRFRMSSGQTLVTNSHVLVCSDTALHAVDLVTHALVWSYPTPGFVAVTNDSLYLTGGDGYLTAINTTENVPPPPAEVHGVVFNDLNGNGLQDPNEPGVPDFRIYADLNGDGGFNFTEPVAFSGDDGSYQLKGLPAGTWGIRIILKADWTNTFPAGLAFNTVTLTLGQTVNDVRFGIKFNGTPPSTSDWPMYQGNPEHTGYVPVTLDPNRFVLRWQKTPSISPFNPATVCNGKIALTGSSVGVCSLVTGDVLWTAQTSGSKNPPSCGYGNMYFQTQNHDNDTYLNAYNLDTGAQVFRNAHGAQWNSYYAPTLMDNYVYINGGTYGGMYCFWKAGGQRWFTKKLSQCDSWTPAVDELYAYAFVSGGLSAINRSTGQTTFSISDPGSAGMYSMHEAPVLAGGGKLAVRSNGGRLVCFDLSEKTIAWELDRDFTGQVTAARGVLYAIDGGTLAAVDRDTGALLWTWQKSGHTLTKTLIATDSHILATSSTAIFAIDLTTHTDVWSYPVNGYLALAGDTIVVVGPSSVLTAIYTQAPAPTISSITPASGVSYGSTNITNLAGTGFLTGATVKLTRDGEPDIVGTSVSVVSPTQITCTFELSNRAIGAWNVVVTNPDNQSATLTGGFTVTIPPPPSVSGITPNSGVNNGPINITNLAGANFLTNPTVKLTRSGQPDIVATSVVTVSSTQITCTFDLAGKAAGSWDIVVTNFDGQSGSRSGGFQITLPPAAVLNSITPGSGPNTGPFNVTLYGNNFVPGASVHLFRNFSFDIVATDVNVVNSTQLTCTLDLTDRPMGYWSVAVFNPGDERAGVLTNGFIVETFSNIGATLPGASYAVACGDYDNDGRLDLAISAFDGNKPLKTRLYHNDGGNVFTPVDPNLPGADGNGLAWGDYDNDGDLDLAIAGDLSTKIFRNDGNGVFSDSGAVLTGVRGSAVAWGDYDRDGRLDLALCGGTSWDFVPPFSAIYHNDGNGTFTNINAALTPVWYGAARWVDVDNDGDLDLAIAGQSNSGPATAIYRNDGGTFVDLGAGLLGVAQASMDWADYDNDGDLDLALTGTTGQQMVITKIYRNDGGSFMDINVSIPSYYGMVAWGDYDADGRVDLLVTTYDSMRAVVYHNDGNSAFADYGAVILTRSTPILVWGDFNSDRRLDIVLAGSTTNIFQNRYSSTNMPPAAPTNLSASVNGSAFTFSWNAASDYQMPAAGLSYNLRVGTTPGGNDVFSGQADPNGVRLLPAMGNVQKRLSWTLTGLSTAQTYYWSVQAIDASFAGSPWAAEQTLTGQIKLAGHIRTVKGQPVAGVSVHATSGQQLTTDPEGYYELIVPYGWSGTLMYDKEYWTFRPLTRSYSAITGHQLDQDLLGYIAGDANLDGRVDFSDYLAVSQSYGRTDATWTNGDFNGDQIVNFSDYLLLRENYDP